MKKIALILVAAIAFIACDKNEHIYFDGGQTGVAFAKSDATVILPTATSYTATAEVEVTTASNVERTFDVVADLDNSDLPAANYTLGSVVIPANSHHGVLDVVMDDAGLADLTYYTLKVDMVVPNGVVITKTDGEIFTFSVLKKVICNDMELNISLDNFGTETTWDIKDDTGAVVQSGGPYTDGTPGPIAPIFFTLADGCYTFTIYDSFGDGLFDGTNEGSWLLGCSILEHSSGQGEFGAFVAEDFCVNQ
ncbi:MAG: hypothetical protein ACPG45_06515 [Flavobacteriaceae bacterium]